MPTLMFKNHQRKSHYKVQVLKCHFQRISIKWKILLKVRMWSASVWRVQWSRWAALFHILMIDVLSVEPVQPKLFFARFSQCISHIPGYNKGRCWNFFDAKVCEKVFSLFCLETEMIYNQSKDVKMMFEII